MNKEEIKQLRLAMGLTQEVFARKVGVGVTTMNRWENGVFKPSHFALEKLEKLQKKYQKSLEAISDEKTNR